MKDIERVPLRPFTRFCMSIGAVPSSYLAGLTIEEQLLWLCSFLEKEVVPVVNNNSEVVEELKNYVEHYFDNLDVQEEINNKLDEMAESGELEEIIAAYLNTRAVLGFNNINDLKENETIEEGAFVRTYGRDSYDDGFGAFYKVRNRTFDDVPDDYNIIVLSDENLVAEKINDYNTQQIDDFVLYAFFDESNNNEIKLYVSKDNLHLEQIILPNKIYGRDPSIAYFNNKFYIAYTNYSETSDFGLYVSDDLINWESHAISVGLYDATYPRRWSPEIFIDNDKFYVIISKQYAPVDTYNLSGKFKQYIVECTNMSNLSFGQPTELILSGTTKDNYIDGTIIKIGDTYHLIVKAESQQVLNLEHFTSTDLIHYTFISEDFGQFGRFAEGPFVYKFNDQFVIGAERYDEKDTVKSYYRVKTSRDFQNFSNYESMYYYNEDISHGSAFVISDKSAKKKIFDSKNYGFKYNYDFETIKNKYIITSNTTRHDFPKGRYLKIMSIKQQISYKIASVRFKISELQSYRFDSLIEAVGYTGNASTPALTNQTLRQLTGKCTNTINYKEANLQGKLLMLPNTTDKCYDIFLDLNEYGNNDMTIGIDIISANTYGADIKVYSEVFTDTLPTNPGNYFSEYRCKNLFPQFNNLYVDNRTNNKLTIKFCCNNTSIKLYGHGNSTNINTLYDYDISMMSGSINAINRNSSLANALSFNVDSYTDGVYIMSITNLQNGSGFVVTLPYIFGSGILDYSLTTV